MLDHDALADIEGDADLLLRLAGVDDEERVDVQALARHPTMTGRGVWLTRGPRAHLSGWGDHVQVCVRRGLPPALVRWLVCHELAELHYRRTGYVGEDREARCDALGAALVAPRRLVRRVMQRHAHRVSLLAQALAVDPELALLRVGEVAGRGVALVRAPGVVLARGDWDPEAPRHPVRVGARWGLMRAA